MLEESKGVNLGFQRTDLSIHREESSSSSSRQVREGDCVVLGDEIGNSWLRFEVQRDEDFRCMERKILHALRNLPLPSDKPRWMIETERSDCARAIHEQLFVLPPRDMEEVELDKAVVELENAIGRIPISAPHFDGGLATRDGV